LASRERNERRFPQWDDLPGGKRRYYRLIEGRVRGYARYVKEVDKNENTIRIVQEIYDDNGQMIGIHQKFPDDTGHVDIEASEE